MPSHRLEEAQEERNAARQLAATAQNQLAAKAEAATAKAEAATANAEAATASEQASTGKARATKEAAATKRKRKVPCKQLLWHAVLFMGSTAAQTWQHL